MLETMLEQLQLLLKDLLAPSHAFVGRRLFQSLVK